MIIVLCPLKSQRSDRWDWNTHHRHLGFWKDDPELLEKESMYQFMPSTHLATKLGPMACSEGHLGILKAIIENDWKGVVICEDDSIVDYEALGEFQRKPKPKGLIYLGGKFEFPKIKDWDKQRSIETYMEGKSNPGFNEITKDFIMTGTFGYYISDKSVAQEMLASSTGTTGKYKSNLTDVMYSKTSVPKHYIYPSVITTLVGASSIGHADGIHSWHNYVSS